MGATIETCFYDVDNFQWGKCECFNCEYYFSKTNASKIIREYIKNRKENNINE